LQIILQVAESSGLLKHRQVGKRWNLVSTDILRSRDIPVTFFTSFELAYFTVVMSGRTQAFFLNKFDFILEYMSVREVQQFAMEFGISAKEYTSDSFRLDALKDRRTPAQDDQELNLKVSKMALTLLQESPNLVKVNMYKLITVNPELLTKYNLPQFKSLTSVWCKISRMLSRYQLTIDDYTFWETLLARAPNLRNCTLVPVLSTKIAQQIVDISKFIQFFSSSVIFTTQLFTGYDNFRLTTFVELQNISFAKDKIHHFTMDLVCLHTSEEESFREFFFKFLESQSGSLTTLATTAKYALKFPKLEILKELDFETTADALAGVSCTPDLIPNVWKLTLHGRRSYGVFSPCKWAMVTHLELKRSRRCEIDLFDLNLASPNLAGTFPNLKFLLLETSTMKQDLKIVFTQLTTIVGLTLVFDVNRNLAGGNDAWDELTGGARRVSEEILLSTATVLQPTSSQPTFGNLPRKLFRSLNF